MAYVSVENPAQFRAETNGGGKEIRLHLQNSAYNWLGDSAVALSKMKVAGLPLCNIVFMLVRHGWLGY
ncbi:hypothetical protein FJU08_21365 [Martelella alba]|uniref:Uncharacterized protein n=1 Tax=Martelella alba TaxID=2590451 RepID=A0A506U074_9HYPH|nr:hypothetical protein FJU08_21365 [Martelella alba]